MAFSLPALPNLPVVIIPQVPNLAGQPVLAGAAPAAAVNPVVDVAAGQLLVLAGATDVNAMTTFDIEAQATLGLEAKATTDVLTTINFAGANGSLVLDADFTLDAGSQVTGFTRGDKIDYQTPIAGLTTAYCPAVSVFGQQITPAITTVTLADTAGQVVGTLRLAGDYRGALGLTADGMGGTSMICLCLLAGTRIRTPDGETAVEELCEGALVATPDGPRAVTWVGRRRLDIAAHPAPDAIRPVRIAAGAFADRQPARDLIVSPDHAIYVDGVLIPAKHLVNGTSIVRDRTITRPLYLHVALASHGVLFAEGLTVESYLDVGGSGFFAGESAAPTPHPHMIRAAWEAQGNAPLVVTGPALDAVRRRLADRAAMAELGLAA